MRASIVCLLLACDTEKAPDREQVEKAVEAAEKGLRSGYEQAKQGYSNAKDRVEEVDWQGVYDETAERVDKAREGLEGSRKQAPPEPEPERWWDRANEAVTCEGERCTIEGWFTRAAKHHPQRLKLDVRVFTSPEDDGWLIDRIRPGCLADVLGFEDGDVIQTVADQPLVDPWARVKALQAIDSARTVVIAYRRGDEKRTLEIVFDDR
jgi:hypothetical protein